MLLLAALPWLFSVSVASGWHGAGLTRRLDEGVQRCAKGPGSFVKAVMAAKASGGCGARCSARKRGRSARRPKAEDSTGCPAGGGLGASFPYLIG